MSNHIDDQECPLKAEISAETVLSGFCTIQLSMVPTLKSILHYKYDKLFPLCPTEFTLFEC